MPKYLIMNILCGASNGQVAREMSKVGLPGANLETRAENGARKGADAGMTVVRLEEQTLRDAAGQAGVGSLRLRGLRGGLCGLTLQFCDERVAAAGGIRYWQVTIDQLHGRALSAAASVQLSGSQTHEALSRLEPPQRSAAESLCGPDGHLCATSDTLFRFADGVLTQLALPDSPAAPFNLIPVSGSLKIADVSCGKEHVLLRTAVGQVCSFGHGSRAQLGHGSAESTERPRLVEALSPVFVAHICAGGWHSVAISDIGDCYRWGWNSSGQLGLPMISSGGADGGEFIGDHQATEEQVAELDPMLTGGRKDAQCSCRANAVLHRAGIADNPVNFLFVPHLLSFESDPDAAGATADPTEGLRFCSAAAGSRHTLLLTECGHVYASGFDRYSQLLLPARCKAAYNEALAVASSSRRREAQVHHIVHDFCLLPYNNVTGLWADQFNSVIAFESQNTESSSNVD